MYRAILIPQQDQLVGKRKRDAYGSQAWARLAALPGVKPPGRSFSGALGDQLGDLCRSKTRNTLIINHINQMAANAVGIEPVSAPNSHFQGNLQGILAEPASRRRFSRLFKQQIQCLAEKFP
jgi:hypothetical protein